MEDCKKLKLRICQKQGHEGNQLSQICLDQNCENYLEILCPECCESSQYKSDHKNHQSYSLQGFYKKLQLENKESMKYVEEKLTGQIKDSKIELEQISQKFKDLADCCTKLSGKYAEQAKNIRKIDFQEYTFCPQIDNMLNDLENMLNSDTKNIFNKSQYQNTLKIKVEKEDNQYKIETIDHDKMDKFADSHGLSQVQGKGVLQKLGNIEQFLKIQEIYGDQQLEQQIVQMNQSCQGNQVKFRKKNTEINNTNVLIEQKEYVQGIFIDNKEVQQNGYPSIYSFSFKEEANIFLKLRFFAENTFAENICQYFALGILDSEEIKNSSIWNCTEVNDSVVINNDSNNILQQQQQLSQKTKNGNVLKNKYNNNEDWKFIGKEFQVYKGELKDKKEFVLNIFVHAKLHQFVIYDEEQEFIGFSDCKLESTSKKYVVGISCQNQSPLQIDVLNFQQF